MSSLCVTQQTKRQSDKKKTKNKKKTIRNTRPHRSPLFSGRARNELVELKADEPGDERSGRRDGRDDLARDELGLVRIGGRNAVVGRAHVGRRGDKLDVPVAVVILFKLERVERLDPAAVAMGRIIFF
jgi:hypothetical protein